MSCGKPHETDCSQVLAEVWLLLDHECSSERRLKLEQHLDECGPCLEQFGLEEHLKELLARKCGGEHAPDTLKERLRASIRQVVVAQSDGAVAVEIHEAKLSIKSDSD
ncbi:MAG TPA: mycothiol system anti-sigma-R factor [Pseudonocardiaceae bacterium]|nr:mycothiol system anti-sigma-R factor [Pseudonocardiaceae bacterium]